jgi:hypothetical protein
MRVRSAVCCVNILTEITNKKLNIGAERSQAVFAKIKTAHKRWGGEKEPARMPALRQCPAPEIQKRRRGDFRG